MIFMAFTLREELTSKQIFAGQIPFHETALDSAVILAVIEGKRPSRPTGELPRTRGLDNNMWNLISQCWASKAVERITSAEIVERVRGLPRGLT
jgi:hypothetical protein